MRDFDYLRPSSLEEACQWLRQGDGSVKVLAGGTDLLIQIKQRRLAPQAVVSLRDVPGLAFIRQHPDGTLAIGAMTPLAMIEAAPEILAIYPSVSEAAAWIGSVQARSRATVGGNLCNAAPSADMAPSLIAYGATVLLTDGRQEREIPLEAFFTGPGRTVLKQGELLRAIHLPAPPQPSFGIFLKAHRSKMDIAIVNVGVFIHFDETGEICRELHLVLGAVAPTPMRASSSEHLAAGCKLDNALIEKVARKASEEARPISDVRSSAEYRRTLVEVLTRRALIAARSWAQKGQGQ
jgi:CO/xanthine dehydrogenase FAD-binding subunit